LNPSVASRCSPTRLNDTSAKHDRTESVLVDYGIPAMHAMDQGASECRLAEGFY
jgi:hypothetical protein